MKKLGILVLFVLASAVTTLGGRYYSYVTRGDDLYD